MEKVGIVTYHRANNYGAVLQAYALQETLNKWCECYILDYRCENIEKSYLLFKKKGIKDILRDIKYIKITLGGWISWYRFKGFRNSYYRLSKKYDLTTISNANNVYDKFVAGSDQIWNLKWSGSDWSYFLDFAHPEKKYSYAASINTDFDSQNIEKAKLLLTDFRCLLVREAQGAETIRKMGVNKDIYSVCDPVYLWNREEWIKNVSLKKNNNRKRKYVLIYFVAKQEKALEYAINLAKEKDWDVIYINQLGFRRLPEGVINMVTPGPVQFLELILNAEVVVTTSFHGISFAIIFNKKFIYEVCDEGGNSNVRIENIENIFDISEWGIHNENFNFESKKSWDDINNRLLKYKDESKRIMYEQLIKCE